MHARLLGAALERALAAEVRARRVLIGPQRDELEVTLGGQPAGAFASAGEQRRAAFGLVMAALELQLEAGRSSPVMLLDDAEAEFDDQRLDRVLGYLRDTTQTLVATSKGDVAARYRSFGRLLRVEQGEVREISGAND